MNDTIQFLIIGAAVLLMIGAWVYDYREPPRVKEEMLLGTVPRASCEVPLVFRIDRWLSAWMPWRLRRTVRGLRLALKTAREPVQRYRSQWIAGIDERREMRGSIAKLERQIRSLTRDLDAANEQLDGLRRDNRTTFHAHDTRVGQLETQNHLLLRDRTQLTEQISRLQAKRRRSR